MARPSGPAAGDSRRGRRGRYSGAQSGQRLLQFANGQPLVVENRPGAGGTIAATAVAREKPDGYTLFLAEVGPNAVSHTLTKLSYDPHTAFTPIIHAANLPAVVLIRPDLPYKTCRIHCRSQKATGQVQLLLGRDG